MVESIIIHAGAPKTATTYIQRALHANRAALAERGVYLPQAGRLELEPNAVCHHHLAWSLISPQNYPDARNPWTALREELATVDAPVVLLSSEVFSRVASKDERATLVEDAVRGLCDSVRIVYFVRNQLSLLNSLYGQRIKSFRLLYTFERHTAIYRERRLFDYEALLKPWYANDALNFTALPFSGERDVDPLQQLLTFAGIESFPHALADEDDDVNSSLGPVGIEAARLLGCYLRGLFEDFDPEEMAAKRLYRISSARAQRNGWCDESFWGWTPRAAEEIVQHFAESNDRFAHDVWGTDWTIPMPVDRKPSAVHLLDLPPPELEKVQRFVFSMGRRFSELRGGDAA